MAKKQTKTRFQEPESVAGNGLLHRRALLGQGALFAGAAVTGLGASIVNTSGCLTRPWIKSSCCDGSMSGTPE